MTQNILLNQEVYSSLAELDLNSDRPINPIYRYVEQYAQEVPEAIAVTFAQQQLSYRELNNRANQLAHCLLAQNVQPQAYVGVLIEPSWEILVTLLAIHKINAVYVPIDPEYPLTRIQTIIQQVAPAIVMGAGDRWMELEPQLKTAKINLATLDLTQFSHFNLNFPCPPESLSHLFFTSGTTGTPKGVVSQHQNLIHYIFAAQEKYRFSREDSFLATARYTFSISLLMLLLPLVCGGQVNIITLEELLKPELLTQGIKKSTFLHLSPSLLKVWLDFWQRQANLEDAEGLTHVKHASSGGDMIPPAILNRLNQVFSQAEVYAIYGSSEISCMGCSYLVPKEQTSQQTLVGKPFRDVELRILDSEQQTVPVGVTGEICVAGLGITPGYLNLPELTADKYIVLDGKRFYRMGDQGRLTPQGELEILGREDNQVQIRGIRIELGEIESCLNLHPAVSQAIAIAKPDALGEKQLIAYVIVSQTNTKTAELRSFLAETLPQYMIPSHLVVVDKFPLNLNGKVDRRALQEQPIETELRENSIAPRTPLESKIAKIWAEVLALESVSVQENFFHLGGHSLLAIQLIEKLEQAFALTLPLAALFQLPTIEAQAIFFENQNQTTSWSLIAPIQPKGSKTPLFLFQGIGIYYPLSHYLGKDQPVYGLSIEMVDESEHWFSQVADLVQLYIQEIRQIQPHGPYYFGGLSFGGIVALEAAQQMQAQGEEVALLALMDAWGPTAFTPYTKGKKLLAHLRKILSLDLNYLVEKRDWLIDQITQKIAKLGNKNPENSNQAANDLNQAYLRAKDNYVPQIYTGKIQLFKSTENAFLGFGELDPDLGWANLATQGLEIAKIPGDHLGILQEPNVAILARELQNSIERSANSTKTENIVEP